MIERIVWGLILAYLVIGLLHQNKGKSYGLKLDLFIDLFFGAAIWCKPGVTISSEIGLAMQKATPPWWARWLNAFLNRIQSGHCQLAIQSDIARAEATIAYLQTKQS